MKDDIRFIDTTECVYLSHPVQKASSVPGIYEEHQKEKHGTVNFAGCPGMFDYKNLGYIIPAWTELSVFGNQKQTMIYSAKQATDNQHKALPYTKQCPFWNPNFPTGTAGNMDEKIIEGIKTGTPSRGIEKMSPAHIDSPWVLESDLSVLLLPPIYHSTITQFLQIWPGIVDLKKDKMNTANIIVSVKEEGEYTIKPGEPLIHVVPIKNVDVAGSYGVDKTVADSRHRKTMRFNAARQWYRRFIHRPVKHSLKRT